VPQRRRTQKEEDNTSSAPLSLWVKHSHYANKVTAMNRRQKSEIRLKRQLLKWVVAFTTTLWKQSISSRKMASMLMFGHGWMNVVKPKSRSVGLHHFISDSFNNVSKRIPGLNTMIQCISAHCHRRCRWKLFHMFVLKCATSKHN